MKGLCAVHGTDVFMRNRKYQENVLMTQRKIQESWLNYVKVRWKKTFIHDRGILCCVHDHVRVI